VHYHRLDGAPLDRLSYTYLVTWIGGGALIGLSFSCGW